MAVVVLIMPKNEEFLKYKCLVPIFRPTLVIVKKDFNFNAAQPPAPKGALLGQAWATSLADPWGPANGVNKFE